MSLSGWNKDNIIQLSIDKEKVDGVLRDFPVLVNLTVSGSGQNNYDCSPVFAELGSSRKKIAIEYKGVQEHWVETVDDDFTGTDGNTPRSDLWDVQEGVGTVELETNRLKLHQTDVQSDNLYIPSKYKLIGDFDIQFDFERNDVVGDWLTGLRIFTDTDWYSVWIRRISSTIYYRLRKGSDPGGTEYVVTTDIFGKLKMVRFGTSLYGYYWGTSGWISIGDPLVIETDNVEFKLNQWTDTANTTEYYSYFDNFKLNYGTIDWQGNQPVKQFRSYYVDRQQCYVEIENWDQTNQEAQLWVKVPYILPDQPTDLLLYYDSTQSDNTTYIGDIGEVAAQNVWDSNFSAVYHMNQDPSGGAGSILDSTSNNNHGTPEGSMDSSDLVDGLVGKAIDFDSVDDRIRFTGANFSPGTGRITVEAMFKTDKDYSTAAVNGTIFIDYGTATNNLVSMQVSHANNNKLLSIFRDGEGDIITMLSLNSVNDNYFHYAAMVKDGTTGHLSIDNEIDIIVSEALIDGIDTTGANDPILGAYTTDNVSHSYFFEDIIDEVRISLIDRTKSWRNATYYSNNDNLITFVDAKQYMYSGYIYQYGSPVQRQVYLYERNSGELMDKVTSSSLGYYSLYTTSSGLHNVMCLDAVEIPDFDDMMISKVIPTEVV